MQQTQYLINQKCNVDKKVLLDWAKKYIFAFFGHHVLMADTSWTLKTNKYSIQNYNP
jgi:hypothetical protein